MATQSPSISPKRKHQLVSNLVDRISPKKSYERIVGDELEPSFSGGERTSPVRTTKDWSGSVDDLERFRIDSNSEDENDENDETETTTNLRQDPTMLPPLPSLIPIEEIPSNFICPLTLQIMQDPVNDCCGHTFERRAIGEWLDQHQAVCPISRKPLVPNSASSSEPVLWPNKGLQQRIQEWKLEHPLYQGADAHYAHRQRTNMMRKSTLGSNGSTLECPHGGDAIESRSDSEANDKDTCHHTLSRFDRLFLPQEREFLQALKERSRQEHKRRNRSQKRRLTSLVVLAIVALAILYFVVRQQQEEMAQNIVEGAR